ncbi:hypothetical protein RI367_007936, partial [Sorochytrium milnesiophthora]
MAMTSPTRPPHLLVYGVMDYALQLHVKGNITAAEVKWETVFDLIAAGRVDSDTLENFLTLAEVFGSFDFQKHTVQLIVHNRQSPDEQMIAVFDELDLSLRDDYKKDAETRALVSQYLHAMSDQKQKIGQDLEDRLTCLKNTLTSANKQALELGDKELLVGDPISGAHGQATTVFAYAWYDNRWCIAKIGDPALMKDEWQQYQRATALYRSRSLVDILAFKTHGDKALLIMPYEAARPSIIFDVVLCVLAALSALAYHGMSHNDIKPSNIVGACNAPHLFVLIDLGSLSNWFVWGDPGTTPLYGDGETPGRPSYDVTCLCNVVTHIAVGTLRHKMAPGIYKELQDILKQAIFPANLYRAEDA